MQAVIGLQQLARVERNWQRRASIWQRYSEAFSDLPVTLPAPFAPDTRHACHLYTILVDENRTGLGRDAFLDAMMERNIGVGVHYLSIPEHPYYQDTYAWCPGDYPHAMRIGRQTVSLPLSPGLSDRDVEDVIEAVVDILEMNA
jgi:dTDP-4-amino-4,6-dideoxygalactose transaminase